VKPPRIHTSAQLSSPTPWFIVACVAIVVALGFTVFTARFVSRSIVTTGTVTGLSEDNGENGKTYTPEYSFTAQDGRTYSGTSSSSSSSPAYAVGQTIPIRYDQSNPIRNRIDSFGNLWGFPLAFILASALSAALGFVMRAARRRKAQPAAIAAK
jgi:Protein of unknown function (DUF3592)